MRDVSFYKDCDTAMGSTSVIKTRQQVIVTEARDGVTGMM